MAAPLDRRDGGVLAAILGLGFATRVVFVALTEMPVNDPWRHLALIDRLQRGLGFSLYDGQPYIWHHPSWYALAALVSVGAGTQMLAALLSVLALVPFYVFLRREGLSWDAAALGAGLLAVSGPAVAYTCHYGPEALALLLVLTALWLGTAGRGMGFAAASGLLAGLAVASRLNLAPLVLLLAPQWRRPRFGVVWVLAFCLPLGHAWWRTWQVVQSVPFTFTWDGLATRSADFTPFSVFALQAHPAVGEALRRLHELVIPRPEWWATPLGPSWGLLALLGAGSIALILSRRWLWCLSAGSMLVAFGLLDPTLSSHFFRIYLGLIPLLCAAVGLVAARWFETAGPWRLAASVLLAASIIGGGSRLMPAPMAPLEKVTPPPALLEEEAYFVNSGYYQPESLIWRFPERRFLGLPIDPDQLDELFAAHPDVRAVLWHDFSVQDEVLAQLLGPAGFVPVREGQNRFGRRYVVLRPRLEAMGDDILP